MHRYPRHTGLLTLLVVLVLTGAPPAAHADSVTLDGSRRAHYERMRLGAVHVDNGAEAVRLSARIPRLHRAGGTAVLVLDVGRPDRSAYFPTLTYEVVSRERREGPATTELGRRTDGPFDASSWEVVACPGLEVAWRYAKDRLDVRVPQACLAEDRGPLRPELQLWYPCECDFPVAHVRGRLLQQGRRGARYFDVDGDGRADTVTESSPRRSRYRVDVDLGRRVVHAAGPRNGDVRWNGARPFAVRDLDRDGDAEVIADPGDAVGDGGIHHLYTMVGGELRPVRDESGARVELLTSGAGMDYYNDFRCVDGTVESWHLEAAYGESPRRYDLTVRSYVLDGSTLRLTGQRSVTGLRASTAAYGNWSSASCLSR